MQTAIENRYKALCRYHLSEPEKEDFDSCSLTLSADNSFDETFYDVTAYIQSFPVQSTEYKILSLCLCNTCKSSFLCFLSFI